MFFLFARDLVFMGGRMETLVMLLMLIVRIICTPGPLLF